MSTSPSSLNLAARHRPLSFSTLTGQRHVVAVLRRAVQDNRTPQQLLFSGGSGLGKTTVARILAGALLCTTEMQDRVDGDPCGVCASCEALKTDSHPDLIEFDAASNGGKDEIREIAARAQVTPMLSTRRIYIIDEAHGLSAPGGQAFLKLLEEPPGHVVFMLCTTDPQKMLKTNRGRCTEFELLPPTRAELVENLARVCGGEGWDCPSDILEMVVDSTDPDLGVRGTVNMLSKLSSVLGSSGTPTVEQAALLLGRASTDLAKRLLDAIFTGSESESQQILGELRQRSSEEAIRATLLDLTRTAMLKQSDSLQDPRAFRAFEEMVTLPKGRQWLDLYVIRLCREFRSPTGPAPSPQPTTTDTEGRKPGEAKAIPADRIGVGVDNQDISAANKPTDGPTTPPGDRHARTAQPAPQTSSRTGNASPGAVNTPSVPADAESGDKQWKQTPEVSQSAPSSDARTDRRTGNGAASQTTAAKDGASTGGQPRRDSGTRPPTGRGPVAVDTRSIPHEKSQQQTKPQPETKPKPQPQPQPQPQAKPQAPMTPAAGYVAAVAKIDPDLAGALRRCELTVGDAVVVRYQSQLKTDIEAGQKILRQVAGRAGLALELQQLP